MKPSRPGIAALLALIGLIATLPQARAAQTPARVWQPIPYDQLWGAGAFGNCFDGSQPNVYLVSVAAGTATYNWVTGRRTLFSPHYISMCGPNGDLYYQAPPLEGPLPHGPVVRFSSRDLHDRVIAHLPTVLSATSLWVYAFEEADPTHPAPHQLWASPDGGLTWLERVLPPPGDLTTLSLASLDGQALYAAGDAETGAGDFRIWYSADAGRTWEPRATFPVLRQYGTPVVYVNLLPGTNTPVDDVRLFVTYQGATHQGVPVTRYLSTDGAHTLQMTDQIPPDVSGGLVNDIWYTPAGFVRSRPHVAGDPGGPMDLSFSSDVGQSWQALPAPPEQPFTIWAAVGNGVLVANGTRPWFSLDTGRTWQPLADEGGVLEMPPYQPLQIVRITHRMVDNVAQDFYSVAAFPEADQTLPRPVAPTHAPGSRYFPPTGHNVPVIFLSYWDEHGGLAQFGNPLTEAFREVSPTDDHVYLTQYFERARLEYHPEFAGTPAAIALGLLGAEQTGARRAAGAASFQPAAPAPNAGAIYFPATQHNLAPVFAAYWRGHGGLPVYGYPISEAFPEVSATDGKIYLVQYFERNRLEYHPELPRAYQVSLGLLGTDLLRTRGWLP